MKKRIIIIALAALVIASALLASGCNGTLNMLMGRWKLVTVGDQYGANQQEYPLPISVDIYPDHTIKMFDEPFGKWTMDRNTYTFKQTDGKMDISGSFLLEYVTSTSSTDGSTSTVPQLTVYVDGQAVSYILQKTADLGPLQSYLRAQASASAAAAVATPALAATPSPEATSAQ
jgi:hypothetical protein